MGKSSTDSKNSKGVKRSFDCVSESHDASPPKVVVTPRTRSRVVEETPKTLPIPTPRSFRKKGEGPVTRTPICTPKMCSKEILPAISQAPASKTKTRRCRSITPETSKDQNFKTRSQSKTPVASDECEIRTTRSRSQTPVNSSTLKVSALRLSRSNTPVSKIPRLERKNVKTANSVTPQSKVIRKESRRIRDSPRLDHTPKTLQVTSASQSEKTSDKTPSKVKITPRKSRSRTPISSTTNFANPKETQIITEKEISGENLSVNNSNEPCNQDDSENDVQNAAQGKKSDRYSPAKCSSDHISEESNVDSLRICMPSRSVSVVNTSSDCKEVESPTDYNEELQKEVEKVKKRRSSIGLGRRSIQSHGGRRSLCPTLPIMSLEDQVAMIDKGLPSTSRVSHLIDISLREAMKRLEERFEGDDCVSDLRLDILTSSEKIGGHLAYQISGLPLESDPLPKRTFSDTTKRFEKLEANKKKTAVLEKEYKAWKALLKGRKLACQSAEREFNEAKSGETSLDEEHLKHLTSVQRTILSRRPKYDQYMKEVQMARETAVIAMEVEKHTSSVIYNFIKASKAMADHCYGVIEKLTLGSVNETSPQSTLKTLLALEDGY